ncbi:MAG: hypothetical protein IJN94_03575 [Clostridia bacterium]|nr:hypothetical protein [Clostridia bacterium]
MANIFIDLFNMSITASYLVLAVVVARLLLKKAPKWINCLLWALVGVRLICPFSFESALSLVPSSQTISVNNSSTGRPFTVQSGVSVIDNNINEIVNSKYYEGVTVPANTFADMTTILSIIWLFGLFAMLLYGMFSYLRLHKKVGVSLLFGDNIYYCDNIDTPFILGFFKPKIYVPSGITDEQISYISLHEKAHLKRKDHWWKPLGFILLSVYWFNPVMWVAYILLCRDIETACDEKVIKNMPNDEKKGYSETLVSCSIQRRIVMACPLAFGEVGVKQRIKSVLNYKKPAFWIVIMSLVLFTVVAVCFISNPVNTKLDRILNENGFDIISANEKNFGIFFVTGTLTDEMFEKDGVYKVKGRDTYNDCVEFNFKEVHSHDDVFTLTFDVTYKNIPDEGTVYVLDANQIEGGLELGEEINVCDATGDFSHYSTFCHSIGPGTEFSFSVPKKWFKNRRDTKIEVELDVIEVVFEKTENKGNSSSIGIIGGADGPTSIIVSKFTTQKEIKKLKEKYPQFFGLDASEGLTVYVTALSYSNYRWYISSNKNPVDPQKIMDFKEFATDDEIPLILSDYNINDAYIEVVPFQHNLSSYLWDYIEDDAVDESEYLRTLIGLSSIYDNSLKTFNATVVEVGRDGIVVEPFENETEKNEGFNQISLEGIYRDVNSKIRVVYDGRIIADHSSYPHIITISSVIAVYNVADEKENAKIVNVDIDKKALESNTVFGYQFDEELFLKEMQEYGAKVNQSADGESYNLVFSEAQYNNFLKDKYNQIASYYNSIEKDDHEYAVIKKVEFDKSFRNLKIYINKELWEVMAYDCTEGVASQAYSYQMFLEGDIGVNVEVINAKTSNTYYTYKLPSEQG